MRRLARANTGSMGRYPAEWVRMKQSRARLRPELMACGLMSSECRTSGMSV